MLVPSNSICPPLHLIVHLYYAGEIPSGQVATLLGPILLFITIQPVTSEFNSTLHASIRQTVSNLVGLPSDVVKRDGRVRVKKDMQALQSVRYAPARRDLLRHLSVQQTFSHCDEGVGITFNYRR